MKNENDVIKRIVLQKNYLLKLVAILLILGFSLQTFEKALILADYSVNRADYEKNCVNKSRPQLKCHGHCQVMKKLQQEEKKDAQTPQRKADKNFDQYCAKEVGLLINDAAIASNHFLPPRSAGKTVNMPRSLLRPPTC